MPNLITTLAVAGSDQVGGDLATFYTGAGTLIGTLGTNVYDSAVSLTDRRIYLIADEDAILQALVIYDEDGTELAVINPVALFGGVFDAVWAIPGGVLVSGHNGTPRLYAYTKDGALLSVVEATIANNTNGPILDFVVSGTTLFYLGYGDLVDPPYFTLGRDHSGGVHAFDLAAHADLPDIVPRDTARYSGITLDPDSGDILVTVDFVGTGGPEPPVTADGYVERWNPTGSPSLVQTYVLPAGSRPTGIAMDPAGGAFWISDVGVAQALLKIDLTSGATLASIDVSGAGAEDFVVLAQIVGQLIDPPPTPDEDPCSIVTPLYFAVLRPSNDQGDILQGGQTPLRDPETYYGGFKPALVLSISAIARVASDYLTGFLPAQSASVRWADTRRAVRQIFGEVRSDFANSELWIYLTSRAVRLAQQIPRLLFYGFLPEDVLSHDLGYTSPANDLVGKDYSLLGDEVLIPKRTITVDHFPGRPPETDGFGVPILAGARTDPDGRGALKTIDVGDYTCQDAIIRRALLVAGHTCKLITPFQNGAIPAGDYGVTVWAPGQTGWTDIVPSDNPVLTIDGDDYALIFVRGKRALTIDAETTAFDVATVDSGASNLQFTLVAGEGAQFVAGDTIDVRLAANSNEPELRTIATIVGDVVTVTEALSGTPANGDTVRPTALVLDDGDDGAVYVDFEGMTADGTESGALLDDLVLLDRHCLENWFLGDYRSGPWLDPPTFEFYPDGTLSYILDRDSWDTASSLAEGYLYGGFVGAFVLGAGGTRQSTRTVMADFARSANLVRGWRGNNQLAVAMLDRDRSNFLGGRPTITDRRDILSSPRFAPTPMREWLCNDLLSRYRANYRDDGRGDWDASVNHANAPSIQRYGKKTTVETYPMVADADTADTVNQQRVDFLSTLRQMWTVPQSLCGLVKAEMLTGVPLTHYGGRGAAGFTETGMWVLQQTIDPKDSRVIAGMVDVEDLLEDVS